MGSFLISALLGAGSTAVLGPLVLSQLRHFKAGQEIRTDGPTWHNAKAGTPTMGGVMFILAVGLAVGIAGWPEIKNGTFTHLYVYAFALSFGAIGFLDDRKKVLCHRNEGLTAREKFILQLLCAIVFLSLMRYEGLLTHRLYLPFVNTTVTISWTAYLLFAAFVIVGCVNAVNLTDGVDGLAASVTAVAAAFFLSAAALWQNRPLGIFSAALTGALGAFFLLFNRYPAKCFMGDTGSLFLGGAVAALAFAFDMPLILIPVGIVYILETLSDIIQVAYFKATHGKRFFKMAPLHHHLERCGWSENKIVAVFCALTAIGSLLAFWGILER